VRLSGDVKALFKPCIDAYQKVADEYPGTPQAERSLYLIATIRNNDTRDPELAVQAYRRYLSTFPAGAQAPSALFLIGFIFNNQIHNVDSAAAAYRDFLSRFPQSEMASSAQYELDHLGQPADRSFPDTTAEGSGSTAKKAPARISRNEKPL
jgi:outer membrane protein assembly factor BamD (BamD/ComL family)